MNCENISLMKKTITLILAIAFFTNLSYSQTDREPRNSIKFGLGTTFLKPGSYFDNNTLHLQYEHTLFKPVRIAIDGFKIDGGIVESDGHEKSTSAYQADAGLNLAIFSNANNALKIGGGGSWQKSNYKYTTSIERDSNNQIVSKIFDERKDEVFGWTAGIEYEVYIVSHIVLGTRLTYKQYQNGDKNYFFGLNAGFRF